MGFKYEKTAKDGFSFVSNFGFSIFFSWCNYRPKDNYEPKRNKTQHPDSVLYVKKTHTVEMNTGFKLISVSQALFASLLGPCRAKVWVCLFIP